VTWRARGARRGARDTLSAREPAPRKPGAARRAGLGAAEGARAQRTAGAASSAMDTRATAPREAESQKRLGRKALAF